MRLLCSCWSFTSFAWYTVDLPWELYSASKKIWPGKKKCRLDCRNRTSDHTMWAHTVTVVCSTNWAKSSDCCDDVIGKIVQYVLNRILSWNSSTTSLLTSQQTSSKTTQQPWTAAYYTVSQKWSLRHHVLKLHNWLMYARYQLVNSSNLPSAGGMKIAKAMMSSVWPLKNRCSPLWGSKSTPSPAAW